MGIDSPKSSVPSFNSLSELVGQRVSFSQIKGVRDQNNEVVWTTDTNLPRLSGIVQNMEGIKGRLFKINVRGATAQHVFPESFEALDIEVE